MLLAARAVPARGPRRARAGSLVDSKSGVSGAGRKLEAGYLFAELDENCRAYKVGAVHRHVPEMEQEASLAAGGPAQITFVPHLLPTIRGIVTSVYLRPTRRLSEAAARAPCSRARTRDERFVRVLPAGETPSLQSVRGSNFCDVNAFADERTGTLILLSALDNLVKGASGPGRAVREPDVRLPRRTGPARGAARPLGAPPGEV